MVSIENINSSDRLARFFKVLGDASRLSIVISIGDGSLSVTEIVKATGLSQTLVSFHLRVMREVDIVRTERNGPFIYYRLSDPTILNILTDIFRIANNKKPSENLKAARAHNLKRIKY